MSKTKFLRCMLTLCLGLACSVGWAQLTEGMVSTSMSDLKPYTLKNFNDLYMGSYTSPTNTLPAGFAFFDDGEDETKNAYKIYCVTTGKWVSYEQAASYSNGTNKVKFVDSQDDAKAWVITPATNGNTACWQIAPLKSDGSVASIYMNWYTGVSGNPVDNTTTTIGYWQNGASSDAGSAWLFTETTLATDEAVAEAKAVLKTGIGYPKTTSAAYVNLNEKLKAGLAAEAVELTKTAYISSTDIQLPEVGKFYRIKGISGNYIDAVNCYSGAQMGMKSDAECSKLGTIFYLDEGNRWLNVGTGTYVVNTREIGADKANANAWTFSASERTFGSLTLQSDDSNDAQCLHDNSGNRADRCRSICGERHDFIIEEVSTETEDAELALALAKVDAKATVATNTPGTAVCQYHYVVNGEDVYDIATLNAAIDAATTADAVKAIVESYSINLPQTGKYYRLKGKYSSKYMDASALVESNIGMTESTGEGSIFYLTADNKLKSVLLGTYLKDTHSLGATEANGNVITFTASEGGYAGYLTLKTNYSGSKYVYDHGDQSKVNRNSGYANGRCDWFMEEVTVSDLTINAPTMVGASATWNNVTKTLPATWVVYSGLEIANATLSISTYDNTNYTFADFTETASDNTSTSLGTSVDIATLEASRTLTAKFTPNVFSSSTDETAVVPVRIYNYRNKEYAIRMNAADDYTNHAVNSGVTAYGENEIWYLVGDATSFKMYSRTAGTSLALTLSGTGSGSAATMTATGTNLCLTQVANGYIISPAGTSEQSFNMHGSAGQNIKLFAATDGGSPWGIEKVDVVNTLTFGAKLEGTTWEGNRNNCSVDVMARWNTMTINVSSDVASQVYYMPLGAPISIVSNTARGYTFNGFSVNNGSMVDELTDQTLKQPLMVEASYTANEDKVLYYTPSATGHPYRIPAIATAPNGDIFAICDHRPCGNDIGYGEVDLVCRVSSDNGVTWTDERTIADGLGHINDGIWKMGFGDPAIVADRERNEVLVMSVCGNRTCWDGNYGAGTDDNPENPNRVARIRIKYDENTNQWVFGEPEEVTNSIYPKFVDEDGNVHAASLFIGAGKICQSRVVKKKDYYRLYCAVWNVTMTQRQHHNYVIYSDDFGETWEVLGELGYDNSPAKYGNEPKCEELPDGTVVLSSRKAGGRYFNLFTFTDDTYTEGTWGEVAACSETYDGSSQGTNGEIYKVKAIRKAGGQICDIMLQSVPSGNGRTNVAIYYKELTYGENGSNEYTPETFSTGWTMGKQVSDRGSAYSTMIMQADGRIGFLFEEEPGGYCIVYIPYTIEEITGGAYSLYTVNSNISSIGIGTFYASEAMKIPEGVKAYVATTRPTFEANEEVSTLSLTELTGLIPAKTGVVLRGAEADYEFIPSISYGAAVDGNMLHGYEADNNNSESKEAVSITTDGTAVEYVLAVENNTPGFYKKDATDTDGIFYVYNNKAYLRVPSGEASALRLRFVNADGTTSIREILTETGEPAAVYDLQGRRVRQAGKGVYIVNGKKVLR